MMANILINIIMGVEAVIRIKTKVGIEVFHAINQLRAKIRKKVYSLINHLARKTSLKSRRP